MLAIFLDAIPSSTRNAILLGRIVSSRQISYRSAASPFSRKGCVRQHRGQPSRDGLRRACQGRKPCGVHFVPPRGTHNCNKVIHLLGSVQWTPLYSKDACGNPRGVAQLSPRTTVGMREDRPYRCGRQWIIVVRIKTAGLDARPRSSPRGLFCVCMICVNLRDLRLLTCSLFVVRGSSFHLPPR